MGEGEGDKVVELEARLETLALWAARIEKRVTDLEHAYKALRDRVKVHESRAAREEVAVSTSDPRVDPDEVPTRRIRKSSTALEAARRASDIAEKALKGDDG